MSINSLHRAKVSKLRAQKKHNTNHLSLSLFSLFCSLAFLMKPIPAKADLFCWPWERGCKVDGKIGTSGNNIGGGQRDGFVIYVKNNTGQKIYVTFTGYVYKKPEPNCSFINSISECGGIDGFRDFGTYVFMPGERAMILNGGDGVIGRNATFAAYDDQGNRWRKKVDMGGTIGSFEFTFN